MVLWRISNHRDLSGLGGERSDGRWHTAAHGKRIVYLSEHPAVALLETLVNLRGNPALFPEHFQLLKVLVPEEIVIEETTSMSSTATFAKTQSLGNDWLSRRESAMLRVPSIPSPESWNYLLNPLHARAAGVVIEWARSVAYDRRLFQLKQL